ncbi:SDR family oxidoreductase [Xanthovirga aplysinae]|uniref:SDR family oxidoreductase n=1 Tax=Xanthovirga aplysinae TaxID=2529853 RepID=UPI0012BC913A|nr:SDR family oxidoreductase [Xanthovirga aplysinae]MTI33501.1 SDR family oxidoreductase [Xanthovirga aplysinae]
MRKLIVVSGGTKGIGRAVIECFADKGFDVVSCSRNQEDLQQLKEDIEGQFAGVQVYIHKADLSVKEEVLGFVGFINNLNRSVDVLVNNTGVFIPGQIHQEEDGVLEQMINTNLYSAYYLTRGLVKKMKENRSGHIFTICSTASITAYVNGGSYGISKFALLGMNKVLREEMKEFGIKVTSVLPGATLTASWEGVDFPPERFMKPEDVAEAILGAYNMSPRSVMEEVLIRPMEGDI